MLLYYLDILALKSFDLNNIRKPAPFCYHKKMPVRETDQKNSQFSTAIQNLEPQGYLVKGLIT